MISENMLTMNDGAPKSWKERWREVAAGRSGGQSDSKIVEPLDGQGRFFLKILRQQTVDAKRRRLFREVSAYRTLDHRQIPKVVDTNVDKYDDQDFKLYIVTEFVAGPTLEDRVRDRGPLALAEAIEFVASVASTLGYCHENDVVHRDVKPDNILLRDGAIADPVLVDFGQAFGGSDGFETASAEEMGNRFLRVPELGIGSLERRDPRTDLTFATGLFLYCLTGISPGALLNDYSSMPHQRADVREKIAAAAGALVARVLALFDRGFRWDVRERWSSAEDLREAVLGLTKASVANDPSDRIRQYLKRPEVRSHTEIRTKLTEALAALRRAHQDVARELEGAFQTSQTGKAEDPGALAADTLLALSRLGTAAGAGPWIHFRAEVVGSEIIISVRHGANGTIAYRTSFAAPAYDWAFQSAVRAIFMGHVDEQIASESNG
jgi:serine/threonine protein kinase